MAGTAVLAATALAPRRARLHVTFRGSNGGDIALISAGGTDNIVTVFDASGTDNIVTVFDASGTDDMVRMIDCGAAP